MGKFFPHSRNTLTTGILDWKSITNRKIWNFFSPPFSSYKKNILFSHFQDNFIYLTFQYIYALNMHLCCIHSVPVSSAFPQFLPMLSPSPFWKKDSKIRNLGIKV